jgi:hypothetical protein
MPYWDIVTRSFRISWNHRYLWLIALFSGEGAAGFNFSYSQGTTRRQTQDFASAQKQVITWLSDHVAVVALIVIAWLLIVIAFFILAAICEGATVRASAEHDAERPFNLGGAWRTGLTTMWVILRFRLLLIALGLPLFLLAFGLVIGLIASVVKGNAGATAGLAVGVLLLALLGIPYLIYLFFLDRLGTRAAVLEQLMARASIVRGHRLLFKRLGRTLLVLLVSIAVSIVLGIALACIGAIIAVPLLLAGIALSASGSGAVWLLIAIAFLIFLPLYLVVAGFVAAQSSTYWTLAFRRLDIDQAPSYPYGYQPPPQPPQVTS